MRAAEFFNWAWRVAVWLVLQAAAPVVVLLALPFIPSDSGELPRALRWFETPDDINVWKAGLYEPQVAAIENPFLRAWYWLGVRNRAMGWQYAAGFPLSQRIPSAPGFKRCGSAWRYDVYGWFNFGAGWKTHGLTDDPTTWLAVPFITIRWGKRG